MRTTRTPKNYITVINSFAAHWNAVNAAMNPDVTLSGGYSVTSFDTARTALFALMDAVVAKENAVEGLWANRDRMRDALAVRIRQYNTLVPSMFPDTQFARMLPERPTTRASAAQWMRSLSTLSEAWALVDAMMPVPPGATLPVLLAGGYSRVQFEADRAALLATFSALDLALAERRTAIEARDAKWGEMYLRMRQYRLMVKGLLTPDTALYQTLPKLAPTRKPKPKPQPELLDVAG